MVLLLAAERFTDFDIFIMSWLGVGERADRAVMLKWC